MATPLEPTDCPECGKSTIRRINVQSTPLGSHENPLYEHRFTFRCSACRHEWTLVGVAGEM